MADWVWLPETPKTWPHAGEICTFQRGKEFAECILVVDRVDMTTNTVYFKTPIPSDIQVGDELIGISRG